MNRQSPLCYSAFIFLALSAATGDRVFADSTQTPSAPASLDEIVVTAQKRQENINNVGMSVQAASGEELLKLGITDASSLGKIVPGFNYTASYFGTPLYTIRGVGFQDTSLAGSPTVSVYVDEVPLPYSILSSGAILDLTRVEVLKGPQGTLFGSNSTGGAINYLAEKPTQEFKAGADVSYGRFNTVDASGFVSGPISDSLLFRVAGRILESGDWQQSYTHPAEWGAADMQQYRAALEWMPNDKLTALMTVSGFFDKGDSQMPQLVGISPNSPTNTLDPRLGVAPFNQFGLSGGSHYPFAPNDDRAADWSACANNSPLDEPFYPTAPPGTSGPTTPTSCEGQRKDNDYFNWSLRLDKKFGDDLALTSLSSFQDFHRHQAIEGDGTALQDWESLQTGSINVLYQEFRLAGDFGHEGAWVVGANYERDKTQDRFLEGFGNSTLTSVNLPGSVLCLIGFNCAGINLANVPPFYPVAVGPGLPTDLQTTKTWAVFGSGDHSITDQLSLQAGVRFTQNTKDFTGCTYDGGDGLSSLASRSIANLLEVLNGQISAAQYLQPGSSGGLGVDAGPGTCATAGPAANFYRPKVISETLAQNNVSWRVGPNWKPNEQTLIYGNVSRGYKSGSFPTDGDSTYAQEKPATQESLLAYEIGEKVRLFDQLQLNSAIFYYDYKDKQLLGSINDPIFGPLAALVNVPRSHVEGLEMAGIWKPIAGLRIAPEFSYTVSKVDTCKGNAAAAAPGACFKGNYYNTDPFGQLVNLTGQQFPASPKWTADLDTQYEWRLWNGLTAFVGGNLQYESSTPNAFRNEAPFPSANAAPPGVLDLDSRALIDLRAGLGNDKWTVQFWGRNVTDRYYWVSSAKVVDTITRYAGMPATFGLTVSVRY
jgi:outer membrane receptor protein involved in Fe transport